MQNELLSPLEQVQENVTEKAVQSVEMLFVNEFTDGILDPAENMLGPLKDGGTIIANIAPGCWGPMMTPAIRGGQEVTKPVRIEGAEVGDSIVIEIDSIKVTSSATASGVDQQIVDRFIGDPLLKVKCPGCGKLHPQTVVRSVGAGAIRCATCDTDTAPFKMVNGYTMALNHKRGMGLTIGREAARKIGQKAHAFMRLPEQSVQNHSVSLAPSDLVGVMTRIRPFIAEIGTMPSKAMPASYNAGDTGIPLIGASHEFSFTKEELDNHRTDGHLHMNRIREGAVLICPVKVTGAGMYIGDLRAMQGDGLLAGHSTNVSGIVQLKVSVLKKVAIDSPILLPNIDDLPFLAKPFTKEEKRIARDLADEYGVKQLEEAFPLSFVGTGECIKSATENALNCATKLLELSQEEVKNRATIAGGVEIGRYPGAVTVTAQFPKSMLKNARIFKYVKKQYDC
ncbi:acetamidase/formamidase family protein [Lysinibacillus sp. 54212]|uniref:acetamidase/formamidase family protein n=1 Tax=Lysinibacillus sp. 54212 TaxID=3119829 RepID=UPI003FA5DEE8